MSCVGFSSNPVVLGRRNQTSSAHSPHHQTIFLKKQRSVAPDKYLVTDKFLDKVKETFENLRSGKE